MTGSRGISWVSIFLLLMAVLFFETSLMDNFPKDERNSHQQTQSYSFIDFLDIKICTLGFMDLYFCTTIPLKLNFPVSKTKSSIWKVPKNLKRKKPWMYQRRVLVSTVNSCSTRESRDWWCTKGKGKINQSSGINCLAENKLVRRIGLQEVVHRES